MLIDKLATILTRGYNFNKNEKWLIRKGTAIFRFYPFWYFTREEMFRKYFFCF